MDIHLRTATSGRSNGVLGRLIHKYQLHQEIETGKVSRKWVSILPTIIKLINQHVVSHSKACPITYYSLGKIDLNTFKVGHKVHVALDKPIEFLTSKRLHGTTFRGSDIRWHPKIKVIRQILLRPDTPMMYLVSDEDKPNHLDPIAYTRNKLQLIKLQFIFSKFITDHFKYICITFNYKAAIIYFLFTTTFFTCSFGLAIIAIFGSSSENISSSFGLFCICATILFSCSISSLALSSCFFNIIFSC